MEIPPIAAGWDIHAAARVLLWLAPALGASELSGTVNGSRRSRALCSPGLQNCISMGQFTVYELIYPLCAS